MTQAYIGLPPPPRRVPAAFRLAELLPFRWWHVWTLIMVAITPIALWIRLPIAFALLKIGPVGDRHGHRPAGLTRAARSATVLP
jgi:hypothetical protein